MPVALDNQGHAGGILGSGGYNPPSSSPKPGVVGASPSLITSTGGLAGGFQTLIVPIFSKLASAFQFLGYDINDFNCEEDCIYKFRQEYGATQDTTYVGRNLTVRNLLLVYRNLGVCTFTISVEVYSRESNKFTTLSKTYKIGSKAADNKLYTLKTDIGVITGERPQITITRKANKGPLSIIRLVMVTDQAEIGII